jgi:hypothetical protein
MFLDEIKAISIKAGEKFTLSGDIGNFKKGDEVTVDSIEPNGDDIQLHLSNDQGIKDTFYLDKDDDFEELS